MKALLNLLRRFSLTGVMVLAALWAGYKLWDYYFDAPWTRDGHVRADVAGRRTFSEAINLSAPRTTSKQSKTRSFWFRAVALRL